MVKVKEKYLKTKYMAAGILLSVNAMIYFKFKLQLKFRNNKNYSSITKFPYRFTTRLINSIRFSPKIPAERETMCKYLHLNKNNILQEQ
jgi:hypothetical protein